MQKFFKRNIAITNEHGSWVFLLSPLLIGIFAGENWSTPLTYLIFASLSGFLIRQPITIALKIFVGRRSQKDLYAAIFWILVYGTFGLLMVIGLVLRGYGYVLYLSVPAIIVFGWHLWLVSHRAERRQIGVEIVASGVLALSAPAAYWISLGNADPLGWWLWGLTWLQSAASIVYAYLRLEQRTWHEIPNVKSRLRFGRRAILYSSFNLAATITLSSFGFVPPWICTPYALQFCETIWGTFNPAVRVNPTRIGLRQLSVSTLFTILFIITWNIHQ
jgi:hypothetical protein